MIFSVDLPWTPSTPPPPLNGEKAIFSSMMTNTSRFLFWGLNNHNRFALERIWTTSSVGPERESCAKIVQCLPNSTIITVTKKKKKKRIWKDTHFPIWTQRTNTDNTKRGLCNGLLWQFISQFSNIYYERHFCLRLCLFFFCCSMKDWVLSLGQLVRNSKKKRTVQIDLLFQLQCDRTSAPGESLCDEPLPLFTSFGLCEMYHTRTCLSCLSWRLVAWTSGWWIGSRSPIHKSAWLWSGACYLGHGCGLHHFEHSSALPLSNRIWKKKKGHLIPTMHDEIILLPLMVWKWGLFLHMAQAHCSCFLHVRRHQPRRN